MTHKHAKEYVWLVRELDLDRRRLASVERELTEWADTPKAIKDLNEIATVIQGQIDAITRQCEEFEAWIETIPDTQLQQYIFLRYVACKSYTDIGAQLGKSAAAVRKAVFRFFEKEEEKLENSTIL